ncbi:hypothetical protein GGS26DRAFT_5188 [Hypomontagnella submonticulosa]|nr:hypothetical protein GGS26DRAFT_5188 [Hypomontagnella submonticulosa]
MDDPWGSPWASSEATPKLDPPTPSPPNDLLSPPPRAFFGSTSSLQSQLPWADDGGFGDWKSTDQTDITANTLDWSVWAEPAQSSQPSPRPDEIVKRSSIALPSSAATSPGLRPLPRSRASSTFRHHSPDPWTIEGPSRDRSRDRRGDSPTTPSNVLGISNVDIPIELADASAQSAAAQSAPETNVTDITENDDIVFKEDIKETTIDGGSQVWEPLSPPLDHRESRDSGADSAPKGEIHDTLSRPPSTLSLGSSNGVDRQDSPITSIDEDLRSRLQTTNRQVSGKVQELVGMYDDLTKAATEEPPPARLDPPRTGSRERSPSQTRTRGAEDDMDFGDFEDAKSEYDKPTTDLNVSTSSLRPSTPKARLNDVSSQDQVRESVGLETVSSAPVSVPVQQLVERFGPIQFDIDFQLIDKLFPDLTRDADKDVEDAGEIPDRLIGDSFATISERKTWYRISRYGSMRKHDSGDEENYHRVEWSTSHLHSDTIKIVRRWMEEDSISGRVTLGAGKRTSVFNWDSSSAAPVDLGKVFARKPSTTHARNVSSLSSNHGAEHSERSAQHARSGSEANKSIKGPGKAPNAAPIPRPSQNPGFGWKGDAIKPPTTTHPDSRNIEATKRIEAINPPAPVSTKSDTKADDTVQTTILQSQPTTTKDEDDEDDWGEMVSSPRVETQPGPIPTTQSQNNTKGTAPTPVSLTHETPKLDAQDVAVTQNNNSIPKLSVFIPQTGQDPEQVSDQTNSLAAKAPRGDPWPLADFSIFENLPTRTPKTPRQNPWPLADFSVFESPVSGSGSGGTTSLKTKSELDPYSRDGNKARATPEDVTEVGIPLKAVLGPIQQQSSHERDQDDIVKSIVQNLPDLSYMLR